MNRLRKYFSWLTKEIIPRAPRIKLGALENCWLIIKEDNIIHKFEIENLSTSGIGLIKLDSFEFKIDTSYRATLNLGDKKVLVGLIPVHIVENIVGCAFDSNNPTLAAEIYEYLKVQISAHSLNQVNEKFLVAEYRNNSTWYTDGKYNQIFFTLENNEIVEFQISFLGNHLAGGKNKELLYGKLKNTDDIDPWISWEKLNNESWHLSAPVMAKQFIQQVTGIPVSTKKMLSEAIDASLSSKI